MAAAGGPAPEPGPPLGRFVTGARMIPKRVQRFPDKIMRKQRVTAG